MLKALKKRLILLYTALTGFILTGVIIMIYFLMLSQLKQENINHFQSHLNTVTYRMQTEVFLSTLWMSLYEAENNLVIHIEDNNTPFSFRGSWLSEAGRKSLTDQVREAARKEDMDASMIPYQPDSGYSSIFSLKTGTDIPAYGCLVVLPAARGTKNLILVQTFPDFPKTCLRLLMLLLTIDFFGILALLLVSLKFVGFSMKPVEEGQRKQTEFIAAASHELRSPLAVISTNAQALMLDDSKNEEFLPVIAKECRSMKRLIDDMLLLASSDAKSWSICKKELDTDTFFIEVYSTYSLLCQKEQILLSLDLPENALPVICVDKQRMSQVLGILLDNAINYSPAGSTIQIRPFIHKSHLVIEVADHGQGIPDESKAGIFERFYQADGSRSDNKHFGLGLSIAKELIHLHNGRILLSDTPGGGCTFRIELPL